jgi:hypothetical protein
MASLQCCFGTMAQCYAKFYKMLSLQNRSHIKITVFLDVKPCIWQIVIKIWDKLPTTTCRLLHTQHVSSRFHRNVSKLHSITRHKTVIKNVKWFTGSSAAGSAVQPFVVVYGNHGDSDMQKPW